jgi:hypothetical protein
MEKEILYLDNSGRSTYCQCKKKYFLQIIEGWQSNFGSTALRYGSCWHAIQEGYHNWVKENGWPTNPTDQMSAISVGLTMGNESYIKESAEKEFYDDYKNFNTAVDMLNAYVDYFIEDKQYLEIIHTEKKFECPIEPENPTEEKLLHKLPPVIFTGKIDQCVKMDNVKWLLDFKTTGWRLDQVIAKANRSPQLIGYSYAGKKILDFEPQGCLCSFGYLGATKSRVTGNYGKVRFEFRRIPQIYTAGDIAAWKLSFICTARDIYQSVKENIWPESFDNCHQYGACSYLNLCQQHKPYEELNFEGFHVNHWNVLDE